MLLDNKQIWRKSGILFSPNVSDVDQRNIKGMFNIPNNFNGECYLGLPLSVGRDKKHKLRASKERI